MKQKHGGAIRAILALTISRLIINVTRRFTYPFLPTISSQLGVPVHQVQNVLAVQWGVGITSPLFGPLAERYGRKRVMIGAMVVMTIASLLATAIPEFGVFACVMIAYGIGKMIYDPAMQAYLGEAIPYTRRAQAIGITELSWAGSLIVAAPVAGLLLEVAGLRAIFAMLTVLLLVGCIILFVLLPDDTPAEKSMARFLNPITAWNILKQSPSALGALLYSLLLVCANEMFFINYGLWMEVSFNLVLTALGFVTIVIAIAEVVGEFTVIGIADRFGKRRTTLVGATIAGLSYAILPGLSTNLPLTLAGLFVMFVAIETAIVASIPLFTEILPQARAVMMSGNFAAHSIGRLSGAWLGGTLYALTESFQFIGLTATLLGLVAVVILWRFVIESRSAVD